MMMVVVVRGAARLFVGTSHGISTLGWSCQELWGMLAGAAVPKEARLKSGCGIERWRRTSRVMTVLAGGRCIPRVDAVRGSGYVRRRRRVGERVTRDHHMALS